MNTADLRTLWVGDIEAWMNEKLIEDVFSKVGNAIFLYNHRIFEINDDFY